MNRDRTSRPATAQPRFDPSKMDWTGVTAPFYFFEPWCAEFTPDGPGSVVISFSGTGDRHRGVEVDVWEDGKGVSLWVPTGARVYWLPEVKLGRQDIPWETRLRELDATSGEFVEA